jgi:hypothetical protein
MDDCEKQIFDVLDTLIDLGEYDDANRVLEMGKDSFSGYDFYKILIKDKMEVNDICVPQ